MLVYTNGAEEKQFFLVVIDCTEEYQRGLNIGVWQL